MAEDKAKLLKSLRIERPAEATPAPRRRGRGWLTTAAIALALAGAGGALAYYAAPEWRAEHRAAETAPPPPRQPAPQVVAAEPARPRALVASGYVVARRKATIAAEITGKVVEVLIEEGMVIKEGDVVARLDSVLAERDLALARSRADAAEAAIGAIAADLRDAERIFARAQTLITRNAVSEAELTKAEARMGVLRAQLKQAQAQFETAKLDANRNA